MRLVIKTFEDEKFAVLETTNDGREAVKFLEGSEEAQDARVKGKRISVYLEVLCDDNEKGADRLLNNLEWLAEEARKRKKSFAKEKKPTVSSRKAM